MPLYGASLAMNSAVSTVCLALRGHLGVGESTSGAEVRSRRRFADSFAMLKNGEPPVRILYPIRSSKAIDLRQLFKVMFLTWAESDGVINDHRDCVCATESTSLKATISTFSCIINDRKESGVAIVIPVSDFSGAEVAILGTS
jgi:hypothetical protein